MTPALLLAVLAALAGNALVLRRLARAVARLEARRLTLDDVIADMKARTIADLEAGGARAATPTTGRPALRLVHPPKPSGADKPTTYRPEGEP
jgi:hypothetical protein